MTKSVTSYFNLCNRQPSDWLQRVLYTKQAQAGMRAIHLKVIALVLRKRNT